MKPLEHNDLSPFEHACALGNLSGLKIALSNQAPDVNLAIYLNGLLLAIENQMLNIFCYLIALDSYKQILSRHYHQIKNHLEEHAPLNLITALDDQMANHENDYELSSYPIKQIELPLFELESTEEEHLSDYESACIRELSAYYESSLGSQSLVSLLQELKDELARRYQENPAIYEELVLPLDWETFKFINKFISEDVQNWMLETYYQHPIHTAWRFVASSQTWNLNTASSQKSFDICNHEASCLLILAWFAAKDKDFPHQELRIQHFFDTLANINREGNRQEAQISFDLIDDKYFKHEIKIDNLKSDKPSHPEKLQKRLISSIIEHPMTSILSDEKLQALSLDFIINHWVKVIKELSLEHYLMLKYYLEKSRVEFDIKPPAAFYDLYQLFSIDEEKYQIFAHFMQEKWGFRWVSQSEIHTKARRFLLENICEQHANAFETILKEMYPEVQQSNIQSLRFFSPQIETEKQHDDTCLKHH